MELDLIKAEVSELTLNQGDILVVTCGRMLSKEQRAFITATMTAQIRKDAKVMILDGGLTLGILRGAMPSDAEALLQGNIVKNNLV